MAPPQTFVIELDGGDKVFSPGDNLTGRVIAQTVDEKKLRGIYLTLKGQGYCHWSESVSYTHLRAHETGRNLVCRLLLEKKNN